MPAALLKGLEAPIRQTQQGYGVCCGPKGSFEHKEPQVEASKEAPGSVCGTLGGVEASGTNCLQVKTLPELYLEDNTSIFHVSLLKGFEDNRLRQQPPPVEVDGQQESQIEATVGHRTFRGQP